jgi:hypothetical protein
MILRSGMMSLRAMSAAGLLTKALKVGMRQNELPDKHRRISRKKLGQMSDQKLRKKLLKKLVRRKLGKGIPENGLLYERELIYEASRRGIPKGLPMPLPAKEDIKREKQKPETYETAREHIKAEEFGIGVKILWKLRCSGRAGEAERKARREGDSFTIATLRFFDAAGADTFDSYLRAFCMMDSLNSSQAQAFYKEVVARKREFGTWDRNLHVEEEEQIRLCPIRNDIADAKMKAYAFKRKKKMLDAALAEAEHIDDGFSKSVALREVAFAFAQSGLKREAKSLFMSAEQALQEVCKSDEDKYNYLMTKKDISLTMAKAGFWREAYAQFMKLAEQASSLMSYKCGKNPVGAEALIEIGLAQWEAGIDINGVESTFRHLHNILLSLPDQFSSSLRIKLGAAYAKMGFKNVDLVSKSLEQFEKAEALICRMLVIGNPCFSDQEAFSQKYIDLVSAIADISLPHMISIAEKKLDIGIEEYGLEEYPILCARGHVALGAAQLRVDNEDSARNHFFKAKSYTNKAGPSLDSAKLLAQMGLAYASAGFNIDTMKKFSDASIEAYELTGLESADARIHIISNKIQAAHIGMGFNPGFGRRSMMYKDLLEQAYVLKIKDPLYSVRAYISIAAAQRKDRMLADARATLKIAEERAEEEIELLGKRNDAWLLLSQTYADFGDYREAKKIACRLNDRESFSKASAAIVIAKVKRAAEIDAEEEKNKSYPISMDNPSPNIVWLGDLMTAKHHNLLRMDVHNLLNENTKRLRDAGIKNIEIRIRITPTNAVVLQLLRPKAASPIIENKLRRLISSKKADYTDNLDKNRKETFELRFHHAF